MGLIQGHKVASGRGGTKLQVFWLPVIVILSSSITQQQSKFGWGQRLAACATFYILTTSLLSLY